MTMPEKMSLTSMDIAEAKLDRLKEVFPEVFVEGKVDFDQLKRALGEWIDPGKERFGLNWPGKAECMKIIQQPSVATLKPVREESLRFDETENLFIEGDNLEVLKLLQKSYFGKVKMIYIDPPYNTGSEFIYPDKFSETLETYLAYSGQSDADGRKFSTNTEASGRYHSRWMSMMYPRLYLAKNLLTDGGLIFISIDDNEQANLKIMCDQIFGEENFLASVAWEKRYTRSNNARMFYSLKDFILVYRKSEAISFLREVRGEKAQSLYSNPDDDPRGVWASSSYVNPATKEERRNLAYKITNPFTGEIIEHPTHAWKYEPKEHQRHVDENRLWWGKSGEAKYPRLKNFLSEMDDGMVPIDLWDYKSTGTTDEGGLQVKELFGEAIFDNPKPTKLIQRMLDMATASQSEDIILDFFAGSATTAHAVIAANNADGGNRRFIMVQLPEPTGREDFVTIAEISKERIRRVARKIEGEKAGTLELEDRKKIDSGFKSFKLDKSNFKVWSGEFEENKDVGRQIEMHIDHLQNDSSADDILYELLLKSGFSLTTKVESIDMAGKKVFSIEDGALLIYLEREISIEMINALADANPLQVICLDEAFKGNDQLKANAVQTFKARAASQESEIVFKTV
ncbi:site-specific DNA-methyltransferase [Paramagnetospirillum kuznetsovii]|uniref:site-specific DNA-methyltransferase (adenine-specific) n=1 Tax=Paramagnetospirillum kuznetsovii TaxID=2053833 RepID=A0A364P1K3_9PROT|nr:site-specific DNA-methyltransferase [Paramagnetospirillum kuznetsovii]RAU23228.1 site-specific DNA-methyltransferase [Paramagnetospirillum kuznetsovii]